MTLSKASLGEALSYYDAKNGPGANSRMLTAARFTERLLPELCPICKGTEVSTPCANCHGSGQLWDEGLVEAVAKALVNHPDAEGHDFYEQGARAVLAALTQEVGK